MDMDNYSMMVNLFSVVIRLGIWGVVGYIMGKKAKDVGLSFATYFILTFLLGMIGLAISIVKINNQKKNIAYMNMQHTQYGNPYVQNPYQNAQNPYQQAQNPYQQGQQQAGAANPYTAQQQNPYGNSYQQQGFQQPAPQQNFQPQAQNYNNNASFGINFTCKECGNVQNTPGFCKVCGAKL